MMKPVNAITVVLLAAAPTMASSFTMMNGYYSPPPHAGRESHHDRQQQGGNRAADFSSRRQRQADNVHRAFEELAEELKNEKSKKQEFDLDKTRKFIDKTVDLFTELGEVSLDDAQRFKDWSDKGFEVAKDLMSGYGNNKGSTYNRNSNVHETDQEVIISLDVPGVDKSDIDIQVVQQEQPNDDNRGVLLEVRGTRKVEIPGQEPNAIPFSKSFSLGKSVDADLITASLTNGVLLIRAPKKPGEEKAPGKKVYIQ